MEFNAAVHVTLPGWEDGKPFEAVLRRPSVLSMAACGAIPNELLACARQLFCEGYDESLPLDKLGRLLLAVAREALVSPSLDELEENGCYLTDMQLTAIYSFAQTGVRALKYFRYGDGAAEPAGDEQEILAAAQRAASC